MLWDVSVKKNQGELVLKTDMQIEFNTEQIQTIVFKEM